MMSEENENVIIQNLKDAGCSQETIMSFVENIREKLWNPSEILKLAQSGCWDLKLLKRPPPYTSLLAMVSLKVSNVVFEIQFLQSVFF